MFPPQLVYTLQTTLSFKIGDLSHGLSNNAMTPAQRTALLPSDPEYGMRVIGSKIQMAGWAAYAAMMVLLKLAMLFLYRRLMVRTCSPNSIRHFRTCPV